MFRGGHPVFQGGQAPSGPLVIRPLTAGILTCPGVFGNSARQSVLVEDRCVVVNITWYHSDLGITGQRRTISVHLVVCQYVEVPDGSAARRITIQRSRGEYLARVLVNDERSVVGELTE